MGGIFSKRSRARRARAQRREPTPTTKSDDDAVSRTSVGALATDASRNVQVRRHAADFNSCQLNSGVNKVYAMSSVASLRHPYRTPPNMHTAPSNGFANCFEHPRPVVNCYDAAHASPNLLSLSQHQPSSRREFPRSTRTTGFWCNDNRAYDTHPRDTTRTVEANRQLVHEYEQFYAYPTYDEHSSATFSSEAASVCESYCSSTAAVIGDDDLGDFSDSLDEQFLEPIFSDSTTSTSTVLGDSNTDFEEFSGCSHTKFAEQVRFESNTSNASSTGAVLGEYDIEDVSLLRCQKFMEPSYSSSSSSTRTATTVDEYDGDVSSHFSDGLSATSGVSSRTYVGRGEDFRGGDPAHPEFDNSFATQYQPDYRVCNIDGCLECADGHREYKIDNNCSSVYTDQLSVSSNENGHDVAAKEAYFDEDNEFPCLTSSSVSTLTHMDDDKSFRNDPAQPEFDNSFAPQNQSENSSRVCNIDDYFECYSYDTQHEYEIDSNNVPSVYTEQPSASSHEREDDFVAEDTYFDENNQFPCLTSSGDSTLVHIDGAGDFRGDPVLPDFDNSFGTQKQSEFSHTLECSDGHYEHEIDSNCSSVYTDQLSVSSQESDHDFAAEEMYFDDGEEFPSLTNISTLPVVDMHNLQKDKLIARGGSGSVYRVRHTETGEIFALKEMDMDTTPDRTCEEMETSIRREEVASKKLAGIPWVVNTHQITREGAITSILMEFCSRGDLMSLMERSRTALTYETIQKIAANIVVALEAIHNRGVVHRDIKPENILQDDKGTLKLTDFDLVHTNMFLEPKAAGEDVGTLDFMSPEVYLGEAHNSTADCWAFGAILHELLTGRPPFYFPGEDEERKMRRVVHEPLPDYGLARTHPVAYDLISALMHKKSEIPFGMSGNS